jgi:hypothetical protein
VNPGVLVVRLLKGADRNGAATVWIRPSLPMTATGDDDDAVAVPPGGLLSGCLPPPCHLHDSRCRHRWRLL